MSIPVLHCWTKLLRSRIVRDSDVVNSMVGGLLETCCARLIRYESLPEDTEDVTLQFLNEDIDTVPERHAFLGNYRRFCADVIEVLVRRTPVEAMEHILAQATNMLQNLYHDHPPFQPQTFSKNSYPVLQVDAQVTVIEAALKGYMKWIQAQGEEVQDNERIRNTLENSLEEWGRQILQARFQDPEIERKIISLMSTLSTKALGDRPGFALSFLEYMLTIRLADNTFFPQYSDAVKDLERICSLEMQKLAMKFADDFMNVYDQLESKVNEMINDPTTDERQRMAYSAFLFIIIHRCTTLERSTQEERMRQMLNRVKDAWRNDEFTEAISSFQSFCGILGMGQLPDFLAANNFRGIQDWSDQTLPSDGQALQASILDRSQHLPLRLTKTLLAASTEKLRDGSAAYETAAVLWAEAIPVLLPNLLQLVSHAQAFNDIDSNWSHLPVELQQVIRRVLTDRFWQAGISTESRDDFFARVSGSKSTFEGFASTVRGTVRQIRESSYYILYSLTRFRDFFYGIQDLPGPLSQALFGHAGALTAHHLSVLLTVSTHLIEGCPAQLRSQFLPPMIQGLFRELDRKISAEWNEVARQVAESGDNDNLTDEMKTESILRQLTYSSVSLVAVLLDSRQGKFDFCSYEWRLVMASIHCLSFHCNLEKRADIFQNSPDKTTTSEKKPTAHQCATSSSPPPPSSNPSSSSATPPSASATHAPLSPSSASCVPSSSASKTHPRSATTSATTSSNQQSPRSTNPTLSTAKKNLPPSLQASSTSTPTCPAPSFSPSPAWATNSASTAVLLSCAQRTSRTSACSAVWCSIC